MKSPKQQAVVPFAADHDPDHAMRLARYFQNVGPSIGDITYGEKRCVIDLEFLLGQQLRGPDK